MLNNINAVLQMKMQKYLFRMAFTNFLFFPITYNWLFVFLTRSL